jgi:hypothetical protein
MTVCNFFFLPRRWSAYVAQRCRGVPGIDALATGLLSGVGVEQHSGKQIKLFSYHVLPRHLQVGDRFSDETGEWEVASRPYSTAGGTSISASVRRVDQPATMEDRTWIAHERICVRAPQQESDHLGRLFLVTLEAAPPDVC